MTESEIEKQILDYLTSNNVMVWKDRQLLRKTTKGTRLSQRGVPDILGVLKGGKFLAIEVKKQGGRLSEEQKTFLKRSSGLGAITFVAYDLQDVVTFFEERGGF